ncbi:unnamed protein product [Staurois parvus]|uniref:Uncharacterized protein n=1 Tax=Staurois parvus TaxID=386267 RepID=A0ABN9AA30_9NEOB|nr:unnamed protein product [Staurois parvus]
MDGEERSDPPGATEPPQLHCVYLHQPGGTPQSSPHMDEGSPGSSGADTPPGGDFSLSLVDTNLPAEAEPELRNFMAKRLSRGAMFEGMGNVASVDLSNPECSLGCYYCLIQQMGNPEPGSPSSEHVVCFLGGSEKGLDLYPSSNSNLLVGREVEDWLMGDLDSDIRPHLSSWFEVSILPIQRIVSVFQEKLAYLLHAALSYTTVEVTNSDERTKNDINRFLTQPVCRVWYRRAQDNGISMHRHD